MTRPLRWAGSSHSDERRYLFLHLWLFHFWLFLQSLLLLHSTHLFFFLSQTSSPLQFLSLWQFFASATTSSAITPLANAESPTRPRALPAATFSRPRRSADEPTTRARVSNRLVSILFSFSRDTPNASWRHPPSTPRTREWITPVLSLRHRQRNPREPTDVTKRTRYLGL